MGLNLHFEMVIEFDENNSKSNIKFLYAYIIIPQFTLNHHEVGLRYWHWQTLGFLSILPLHLHQLVLFKIKNIT